MECETKTDAERDVEFPGHRQRKKPLSYSLWFDGATKNNQNASLRQSGWGFVILDSNLRRVCEGCGACGNTTNNVAEYYALQAGLAAALRLRYQPLTVHGDSKLVIHQVTGSWQVKKPHLQGLRKRCHDLATALKAPLYHVKRKFNGDADAMANKGVTCDTSIIPNPTKPLCGVTEFHPAVGRSRDDTHK